MLISFFREIEKEKNAKKKRKETCRVFWLLKTCLFAHKEIVLETETTKSTKSKKIFSNNYLSI